VLRIGGSSERDFLPSLTPFSKEIMKAPRPYKKVKIPTIEFFDRISYPYDHLDIYKAKMYVNMLTMILVIDTSHCVEGNHSKLV